MIADIKLDRIPAYPIIGHHSAQLVDASVREFLLDPKIFVKAQVAAYERYQPDIIVMERAIKNCIAVAPDDSGYILSSGCEVPGVAPPEKVAWFIKIVNELCVNA